jgi:hypothetical protein
MACPKSVTIIALAGSSDSLSSVVIVRAEKQCLNIFNEHYTFTTVHKLELLRVHTWRPHNTQVKRFSHFMKTWEFHFKAHLQYSASSAFSAKVVRGTGSFTQTDIKIG